jgi:hypothetical protein
MVDRDRDDMKRAEREWLDGFINDTLALAECDEHGSVNLAPYLRYNERGIPA